MKKLHFAKKPKAPKEEMAQEILQRNELDANRQMVKAALLASLLLLGLWILYLTGVFTLHDYLLVNIFFPLNAAILASAWLVSKTKLFYSRGFKYLLLGSFISVIFVINVVVPKHGVLAWALPVLLANHFYNPKTGKIVFITTLIAMLIAIYMGALFGEYDANLLTSGVLTLNQETGEWYVYEPDGVRERVAMLNDLLQKGDNRYLKIFIFYYLARGSTLAIIFFVSNGLNVRTARLMKTEIAQASEKKSIEFELNVANGIQQAVLSEAEANLDGTSILAELVPTKGVAGDLYQYFKLDDRHLAICVGDVSGKGIPAAMFMMKTVTCLKAYAAAGKKPSEILSDVNRALIDGNELEMFVTCFFGILDLKTGEFEFANAGHNKPIIGHNGSYRYLPCSSGFILGAMDPLFVQDEKITIQKGDTLFLYTDGVTEAKNEANELYGELRLLRFFGSKNFSSLLEMHYELKDDLRDFVGNAEQADDMTYLFLSFQGDEVQAKEINVPAVPESVSKVLDFIEDALAETGNSYLKPKLHIVTDEIISNIVKYAYPEEPKEMYVRFLYNKTHNKIILTFVDRGVEFNPLTTDKGKDEVDIDGEEGGLGIHIVKNVMDSVTYNRIHERNILVATIKAK